MTATPTADPSGPSESEIVRLIQHARSLVGAGRFQDAVVLLQKSHQAIEWNAEGQYVLGDAAFRLGDDSLALRSFSRSVDLDPSNGLAHYGVGVAFRRQGRREEAIGAFEAALSADGRLERARQHIAALRIAPDANSPNDFAMVGGEATHPSNASVGPTSGSLAELLDQRGAPRPSDAVLAGEMVWAGHASTRSLIPGCLLPWLILVVPLFLGGLSTSVPESLIQDVLYELWRIASAFCLPLVFFLVAVAIAKWSTVVYIIRRHRIDVISGILVRQHQAFWLHDLERPALMRQKLWHIATGVGAIEIESTVITRSPKNVRAGALGKLTIKGLRVSTAEQLTAFLWSEALWQRRRMVQNFVSTR